MVYSTPAIDSYRTSTDIISGTKMDRYLEQFIDDMMEKQVYRNGIFKSFNEYIIEIFAGIGVLRVSEIPIQ